MTHSVFTAVMFFAMLHSKLSPEIIYTLSSEDFDDQAYSGYPQFNIKKFSDKFCSYNPKMLSHYTSLLPEFELDA